LAALALPKAGGTVTGDITLGVNIGIQFEGTTDDANEIRLIGADATADRTITLPNVTGTVITTGDSGTVTSTMIADGTIVNADINASAAIADTKLATISTAGKVSGSAITSGAIATSGQLTIINASPIVVLAESDGTATHSQTALARNDDQFFIQTRSSTGVFLSSDYVISADASGATDHIWRIANTEKARLNSSGLTVVDDLTISDKIIHAGDTNTAIRFPAADTIAFETNGSERARIDSSGNVGIGTSSPATKLHVSGTIRSSTGADVFDLVHDGTNATLLNTKGSFLLYTPVSTNYVFHINEIERFRITSAGALQIAEAGNIQVGTTTGTKIGTATTQRIGFYDATPVVQPTAVADATDAATVITQLNALLTRMRNLGLIAT
jgi:hypothetical protein